MNFFIKIINEVRSRQAMKVDGRSGARFIFAWNPELRAYCYTPKNQNEVDDLFGSMGRLTSYQFAPVNIAPSISNQPPSPPPPPAKEVLDDSLTEQCLQRGVIVTEDDTNETAQRLIAAYDKGAVSVLHSKPQTKGRRLAESA